MIAPTPNCGHGGDTFTWIVLAELWMCPLCVTSIGRLYATCSSCGGIGLNLFYVHRVGQLCVGCRRGYLQQRRIR